MNTALIRYVTEKYQKKNIVPPKTGDVIRVHQKVQEGNRERIQIFEGIVVKTRGGRGTEGSFTVRKISEGIGVERNFPLHLPSIIKIERVKHLNLRKARAYYLRDLTPRQLKKKTKSELGHFIAWEEAVSQEKITDDRQQASSEGDSENIKVAEEQDKVQDKSGELTKESGAQS